MPGTETRYERSNPMSRHTAWTAPGTTLPHLECDPCLLGVMTRRRLDGQRPHIEPFPLALRRESLPIIARRLSERRRAVHGLLDEGAFIAIDADPADGDRAWANLNVPADVESFKKT